MLAIVCPGQGSQTPGFLSQWLEVGNISETLKQWSKTTDVDLITHGTTSDAETIKDTAIAQPLIVAAGLVTAQALKLDQLDPANVIIAGHSVGEITASAIAGALSPQDALNFVRVRAEGMAEAAAQTPTGMAAVLGGDETEVLDKLKSLDLQPANMNGGGQIVAAGHQDNLAKLAEDGPAKARVIPLQVAGAFHTSFMDPAVAALEKTAKSLSPQDPKFTLLSNKDGDAVVDGPDTLDRLVGQVTRPVRWDLCMESLAKRGVTGIIELLPGGTLTGLARRGLKGIPSVAIKSIDDLDKARDLIEKHA